MFKVHVWWYGFNGYRPNRIHFFSDSESCSNYIDLCIDMGWDWASFFDAPAFSGTYILANKSF